MMKKCACGLDLHYNDLNIKAQIERLIADVGEYVDVKHPSGTYKVQRHYIALHGLRAVDLVGLAEQGIIQKVA